MEEKEEARMGDHKRQIPSGNFERILVKKDKLVEKVLDKVDARLEKLMQAKSKSQNKGSTKRLKRIHSKIKEKKQQVEARNTLNELDKNIDYKEKINRCEKLGALKFQKVVLGLDRVKYKVMKKLFPKFPKYYDKYCDRLRDRELKKATSEEERKRISHKYKIQKILLNKEWQKEQSRNYHINKNNVTEFVKYLEWNKGVHKRGMVKNAVVLSILTAATISGATIAIPFIGLELCSLFKNFECVNIQNYNIYRYKEKEKTIKKLATRTFQKNQKNFGTAAKVITKTVKESPSVPSLGEVIDAAKTPEELRQLREMILATLAIPKCQAENKGGKKNGK